MIDMQPADEILPGLWMGDVRSGKMAAEGIGSFDLLVNLTGESTAWPSKTHGKTYVNFHFGDGALPDLDQIEALASYISFFLTSSEKDRRVLVHCTMGINRSGLLCALVVRKMKGLSGLEALRLIRQKRRVVGTFMSPGTGDQATDTALFNSTFVKYLESLP